MEMRARLLKGSTALLYFGPLLAGLGGYGWAMVPAFVAIFVLGQMILRPHLWPRAVGDLQKSDLWISLCAQVAVQVLMVVVFFGVGRGIGGAAGSLPVYSPYLPLALSFLSVPLARMLWDPWKGDSFEAIDAARYAPASPDADQINDAVVLADRLLQPLQDMAGRTSEAEVLRHLKAMAEHVDPARLRDALLARVAGTGASQAILMALIVQTTDPVLMGLLADDGPARALQHLPDDAALLALFAARIGDAVSADRDLAGGIPPDALLHQRAERIGGDAATALRGLSTLRDVRAVQAA